MYVKLILTTSSLSKIEPIYTREHVEPNVSNRLDTTSDRTDRRVLSLLCFGFKYAINALLLFCRYKSQNTLSVLFLFPENVDALTRPPLRNGIP